MDTSIISEEKTPSEELAEMLGYETEFNVDMQAEALLQANNDIDEAIEILNGMKKKNKLFEYAAEFNTKETSVITTEESDTSSLSSDTNDVPFVPFSLHTLELNAVKPLLLD